MADPLAHTTTYGYDLAGNLLSILDANGHQITLAYDALNRLSQKTWPDGSFEGFGYDPIGNQTSHRLADGNTNNFAYDVMNRLSQISYFDGQMVSFAYTPDSQRQSVTDSRGVTQYQYDHRWRLTRITLPNGQTVSYSYDAADNRLSMTTLAGTVTDSYDAANQLASVTDPQGGVASYSYDNMGLRTQLTLPNGVTVGYGYDVLNRLIDITQRKGGTTLASYSYTLGPAGNRTGVTEADGSSFQWGYDDAYRLTEEKRLNSSHSITSDTTFTYDPVGNRLSQAVNGVTTNYTYNSLDQLISDGTATYGYDGRANLSQITKGVQVTHYTFDAANRLVGVALPIGTTASYLYDADGRRVKQTVGTQVTNYLWDEASPYGDVVAETDGSGALTASYVLGGAELLSQTRNGTTNYYLHDGQGSTRTLTNGTGNITDQYTYDAFGNLTGHTGTTSNPYLYAGQQFDDRTGLYSLRARYYAPGLGRFLSRDTAALLVGNPIEANRYIYVANNPINTADPTGHNSTAEEAELYSSLDVFGGAPPEVVPYEAPPYVIDPIEPPGIPEPPSEPAIPKIPWGAPYIGPLRIGPYIIGPYLIPLALLELVAALTAQQVSNPHPWPIDIPVPVPTPQPFPVTPGPTPPVITPTPTEKPFVFYFRQVGPYNAPGRPTADIINDLQSIRSIPGLDNVINYLKAAQTLVDDGNYWATDILMGRKFEAERILVWARTGQLVSAHPNARDLDMTVSGAGTITFVEVKWSRGPLDKYTICCSEFSVVAEAQRHPSGTYLLEASLLDLAGRTRLKDNGGVEWP